MPRPLILIGGVLAGCLLLIAIVGAIAGRTPAPPVTPTPIAVPTQPPAPAAATAVAGVNVPTAPTPTAAQQPTSAPPEPTAAPARVKVSGVGADGLNVRTEPSANAPRLKTIAEGAELEIAGEDRQAEGRTWRNVRDPSDGAVGWAAADFLAAPGQVAAPAAKPEMKPAAPTKPAGKPSAGVPPVNATTCPQSHPIKGNRGPSAWIYHTSGSGAYRTTQPEECFATPGDAAAAGYRAPN